MPSGVLIRVNRFTEKFSGQIILILVLFFICRLLCASIFYEGFLHTFERFNSFLFGINKAPAIFIHVPYFSSSVILSALTNLLFLLGLVLFCLPLYFKRKLLSTKENYYPSAAQWLVFASAFILAWELSTYNYNYYLNQAFYFDRLFLLLLSVLLLRYPILTPVFIAFAYLYRSQFNFPVDGFPLFDKRLLFDLLLMFTVYLYAQILIPAIKIPFLFFALCIVASNYFMSGVAKISMSPHGYEWLLYNNPGDLFLNVHLRGWLSLTPKETITGIYWFLNNNGKILQIFILLIELSGLFLFQSRKLALTFLILFCFMHLGIFIFGSMLFWKWMFVNLLLTFILFYKKGFLVNELFSRKYFMASLPIIITSFIWLRPVSIGWFDTPVNQFFTYEVEDKNGKIYELEKNEMNPYHQWFQYDRFLFLMNQKCLPVSGFGYVAQYKLALEIKNAGAEGYFKLEEKKGENSFDSLKKQNYEAFIKTYFLNRNKLLENTFILSKLSAPHHLYNSSAHLSYHNQEEVRVFRVIFNQFYSQKEKITLLNKKIIDEVLIP